MDIKALRDKLGLTQRELAQRLNTTETTVSRWERRETSPQPYFQEALKKLSEEKVLPYLKCRNCGKPLEKHLVHWSISKSEPYDRAPYCDDFCSVEFGKGATG